MKTEFVEDVRITPFDQQCALPFAQRKKLLSSEEFKQRFSPDEQKLVLGAFPGVQKQLQEDHH